MKAYLLNLLKDKNGNSSLRELVIAIMLLVMIISWVAQQFFGKSMPEYMFYTFGSLVASGCFGYSLERKTNL